MRKYIELATSKYPLSLANIQSENPEVSFPTSPTDEQLLPYGHANVFNSSQPPYNSNLQYISEGVPVSDGNQYNQVWIVTDYTQEELDANQLSKDKRVSTDMQSQGQQMTLDDDARTSVGSPSIIEDRPAHDTWMQTLYADDTGIATPKPPPDERQAYTLTLEDADPFTFTRYHDQWGYRWRMDLTRDSVNALALFIQDSNGNYLYTTGALLDNGDGGWYTQCPAGSADPTPENVYFKWILGSAPISQNFVYLGSEDTLSNTVKSDPDYD